MKAFLAFFKKELVENWRTYRLIILLVVLVLFGIMSPLIAKLTPEILKSLGDTGMTILIPEPTWVDAWMQFFSNIGQMGILVLIIVFCGITANEFSRGTLVNLLTKGLKRRTVVLSKFLSATLTWTVGYLICLAVCFAYTAYFWPIGEMHHVGLTFGGLWLFGELVIALLLFGGILFKNVSGALLSCGGVIVVANLLSIIPGSEKFNPLSLAGETLKLLTNEAAVADFAPAFIISGGLVVALIIAAIAVFNRKQV